MTLVAHPPKDAVALAIAKVRLRQAGAAVRKATLASDIMEFARLCWIMDPVTAPGGMPFEPWDWQVDLLRLWQDRRLCCVLKARQLGVSWLAAIFALWVAMFNPGQLVLIVSIGQREADKFLAKCKYILERLPPDVRPPAEPLARTIRFPTLDSEIESLPSGANVGRSRTASLVIADEHAHQDYADDAYIALDPVIQAGGRFLSLSTANGLGALHTRLYKNAKAGENGYVAVFIPWSAHPDRDEAWYAEQRKTFNSTAEPQKLAQEYPRDDVEAFVATGNPVWTVEDLQKQPIETIEPVEPGTWIYRPPERGAVYAIGADPAEGDATSDWSSAMVLRIERTEDGYRGEQVAAMRGKWQPEHFARLIHRLALRYSEFRDPRGAPVVTVGVERNNHGHTVILRLTDLLAPMQPTPYNMSWWGGKLGWLNNKATKPILVDELAGAIRDDLLIVRDPITLSQMSTFQSGPTGGQAQQGFHDDDVIALGIAHLQNRRAFGSVLDVRKAS